MGKQHDETNIEDLLFATLDAVSRFRVGQKEAVSAALEAGGGGGCSPKPRAGCNMGSGETGLGGLALRPGPRERG